MRIAVALGALLLGLGLASSAEAGKRMVPQGFYGVAFDGASAEAPLQAQDRQFELMALSGVESVRLLVAWSSLQPRRNEAPNFASTDRTIAAAAAHRVEVLPTVLYTPYWARKYKSRALSPPAHNSAYAAFVGSLIRRYGPRGSFWSEHPELRAQPVRQWQLWNEPNIRSYWDTPKKSPYAWPRGYARLLRTTNATIKRADPGARTVFAGLTGVAWNDLSHAYKFGIRGHFDVAALQVYPQTERRELEVVRRFRRAIVRARDRRARLYVTEVAFPASKGRVRPIRGQRQETPRGMARRLGALYGLLAKRRRAFRLERIFWYTWASRYGRNKSNFDFTGLVKSTDGIDHRAQPALRAFQRSARRWEGCVKGPLAFCP